MPKKYIKKEKPANPKVVCPMCGEKVEAGSHYVLKEKALRGEFVCLKKNYLQSVHNPVDSDK